ncbi:DM13 domain-containing protein [Emticicia sp. 17c]|uniref:DM13 domain-containing protein n=1 Tax=Emticicia sp. 17c TaxID=3127704 RepID=UPI00301E14D4
MKLYLTSLCFAWVLSACQKEDINNTLNKSDNTNGIVLSETFNPDGQNLLLQGNFENAVHSTSGSVKIYEDKDKKRTLVLENLKTDAGPDLRIYLAEDKSLTNFIQITDKVQNGSVALQVPSDANLQKQNHVLIWCRKYSVLFGFAQMK